MHHHATTDSVEWIRDDARDGGHNLGNHPLDDQGGLLGVGQHATGRVVEAEIGSTIDDDTLDRDVESTVQADNAIRLNGLGQAVS